MSLDHKLADAAIERVSRCATWWFTMAVALAVGCQPGFAQSIREFHRTLTVAPTIPVSLDIEISRGDLEIAYSRDGEVAITAIAQISTSAKVEDDFLSTPLAIEQNGNRLRIRQSSRPGSSEGETKVAYRIDVPYRTEVHSVVDKGNQKIIGVLGPVEAVTRRGDIKASYISKSLLAQAGSGNLDLQVIGEHVNAKTGNGNISCIRASAGVSAETEDGDITLMVVGSSTATVKKGSGRIDAGGIRGTLSASSDTGELRVKAVPHDDWKLNSNSGNIRVELPPSSKFELDATTNSGAVSIDRDDVEGADSATRHFHYRVNGGDKRIEVHTGTGRISIM